MQGNPDYTTQVSIRISSSANGLLYLMNHPAQLNYHYSCVCRIIPNLFNFPQSTAAIAGGVSGCMAKRPSAALCIPCSALAATGVPALKFKTQRAARCRWSPPPAPGCPCPQQPPPPARRRSRSAAGERQIDKGPHIQSRSLSARIDVARHGIHCRHTTKGGCKQPQHGH